MIVKIKDIRKITGNSKIKAFVAVEFGEEITVPGFCVAQGPHGLQVHPPRRMGKDGRYYDAILLSAGLATTVQTEILLAYDKEGF